MKQSAQDQRASKWDGIGEQTLHVYSITNSSRRNMEHSWLPTSKNKKRLNAKKVRFISTLTAANKWDILAELASLITSDLNSNIKDKFTDFTNR